MPGQAPHRETFWKGVHTQRKRRELTRCWEVCIAFIEAMVLTYCFGVVNSSICVLMLHGWESAQHEAPVRQKALAAQRSTAQLEDQWWITMDQWPTVDTFDGVAPLGHDCQFDPSRFIFSSSCFYTHLHLTLSKGWPFSCQHSTNSVLTLFWSSKVS